MCLSIRERLGFLKRYDIGLSIFGAWKHRYCLQEPLDEGQIAAFEERYRVSLPSEYRDFIRTVGKPSAMTGAGPYYGLYPLQLGDPGERYTALAAPFPLSDGRAAAAHKGQVSCETAGCSGCEVGDTCRLRADADGLFPTAPARLPSAMRAAPIITGWL